MDLATNHEDPKVIYLFGRSISEIRYLLLKGDPEGWRAVNSLTVDTIRGELIGVRWTERAKDGNEYVPYGAPIDSIVAVACHSRNSRVHSV